MDWTVPGDNQRVSNAVFQRSPIIIVVGYVENEFILFKKHRLVFEKSKILSKRLYFSSMVSVSGLIEFKPLKLL